MHTRIWCSVDPCLQRWVTVILHEGADQGGGYTVRIYRLRKNTDVRIYSIGIIYVCTCCHVHCVWCTMYVQYVRIYIRTHAAYARAYVTIQMNKQLHGVLLTCTHVWCRNWGIPPGSYAGSKGGQSVCLWCEWGADGEAGETKRRAGGWQYPQLHSLSTVPCLPIVHNVCTDL